MDQYTPSLNTRFSFESSPEKNTAQPPFFSRRLLRRFPIPRRRLPSSDTVAPTAPATVAHHRYDSETHITSSRTPPPSSPAMGALPADFAWTSEDDFKLKTAAQSGVPLESIATGAVKFSKQFTIQELHDRWHALLYDPVISAEASARMLEFEFFALSKLSIFNDLDNLEENISVPRKRKPEGVRKRYYAMRKRTRIHPLNPLDPNFPDASFNPICIENEEQPPPTYFVAQNNEADTDYHADMDLDVNNQQTLNQCFIEEDNYIEESDEFKEIYDLLEDEGPEFPSINPETLNLPHPNSSEFHFKEQSMATTSNFHVKIENEMCGDINANNYLMEISNTLFDLGEDDLPPLDADGNVIDKSYIDGLSSLLLDSPKRDINCDSIVEESKSLEGILGIMLPSTTSVVNCKSHTSVIICTLNTEDPDIPSNDDVFLLPFSSPYAMQTDIPHSSPHQNSNSFRDSVPNWKNEFRVPKSIPQKDTKYQKSQFDTPIIGSQLRTETLGDHRIKQDLVNNDGQSQTLVHPIAIKSEQELHHGSDIFTNCVKLNPGQEEETLHEIDSKEVDNPIVLQLSIDDDMSSVSDDEDIPSFSDVEAMILDEKLCEEEKSLYLNGNWSYRNLQTLKYKNPNFQRKFIRLEQAANGYMKRDMSSSGAFALLQGWQFIYHVKKPEILLGRATEDVIVDVDLGREGSDCRISRRQAIIQLDREGFFHIKNLGKYSIFVNSDELSTNQSASLTSSCLIEIRGMPFLFETNEESIKSYVESMKNKSDVED
ncbi:unnamed protein product [Lactuca saligna]|uniref:FHA domain-containing protein n=1 Tax=Lactuca saligna TaxID=75948 RepID=A0AA35Z1P1_LACSI|nr:unnamed protein product [Lactuca saligna]